MSAAAPVIQALDVCNPEMTKQIQQEIQGAFVQTLTPVCL